MKKNEAAESARLAVLLTDILLSQQLGQKIPAKGAAFERLVVDYLMDNASYIDSCRKSSSADWFRGLVPRIGSADWFRGLAAQIGVSDLWRATGIAGFALGRDEGVSSVRSLRLVRAVGATPAGEFGSCFPSVGSRVTVEARWHHGKVVRGSSSATVSIMYSQPWKPSQNVRSSASKRWSITTLGKRNVLPSVDWLPRLDLCLANATSSSVAGYLCLRHGTCDWRARTLYARCAEFAIHGWTLREWHSRSW
jgi:hypothetical protein